MWLAMAAAHAQAVDLHVHLTTEEGIDETYSWASDNTFSRKFGPRKAGKSSVVYALTIPTAVYDEVGGGYSLEVSMCLEWSRKGDNDRWCDKQEVLAPPESAGPVKVPGALKGKDKFAWTIELWFTGEPPNLKIEPLPLE
jgi:hypothetical protein